MRQFLETQEADRRLPKERHDTKALQEDTIPWIHSPHATTICVAAHESWSALTAHERQAHGVGRRRPEIEGKDKWVKARVTLDSGAAGHVMPEGTFPRVKLGRKSAAKKFVAANGEQLRDQGGYSQHSGARERRQTSYINAECRPSWKHCGVG